MNEARKLRGIELSRRAKEAASPLPGGHSLVAYFAERRPVGGFMTALLANDLMMAFAKAALTSEDLPQPEGP